VFRFSSAGQVFLRRLHERQTVKDLGVFLPVRESAGRDRVSFSRLWSLPDLHELTWAIIRKSFQQYCVHYAENRRVRSDAERECEHGHGGEAGVLQQLAESESQIVHGSWSVVSSRLLVPHSTFRIPDSNHSY